MRPERNSMKNIKKYALLLVKRDAIDEILKDLKNGVLRELKKLPEGKQIVEGVDFHRTFAVTRKYAKDIADVLKDLKKKIEEQKKRAEDAGKVRITKTETFDAEIPKQMKEQLFDEVAEYRHHFNK